MPLEPPHDPTQEKLQIFLANRLEENSPFLTPSTRYLSQHLELKISLGCLILWLGALATLLFHSPTAFLLHNLALTVVYFLLGTPMLIDTIASILARQFNINVLMGLSAFAAAGIGSPREGALLLILFTLSAAMEELVMEKANSSLGSLHDMMPKSVHLLLDTGKIIERSIKDIELDQKIVVKQGQRVPLDGLLLEGPRSFNMAHLTGEALPVTKKAGEEVAAGAIAIDSFLELQVTRTYLNSTLNNIYTLIAQAQQARPHLQRWLDTFSEGYSITIILSTLVIGSTIPLFFSSIPYLTSSGSIYRALSFMIAASPCALIIATPIAYLSAISSAASLGILLKGGAIIDALTQCRAIAFDKTGTLTTGILKYTSSWLPQNNQTSLSSENAALKVGTALTLTSHHPISRALTSAINQQEILPARHTVEVPGLGISGEVHFKGEWIGASLGRYEFIQPHLSADQQGQLSELLTQNPLTIKSSTFLAFNGDMAAFHFEDSLRHNIASVIDQLGTHFSLQLHLLSGDTEAAARHIAHELHIPNSHGNLLPEQKLAYVENLASEQGLIMVGDGMNDAPSLARATVGISLGGIGSSTAIAAADIVFLKDDLSLLPWLLKQAFMVKRIVKQNITLALLVILGAGTASLFGSIPLWAAVLLHEGGTVLVGLNGLRLLKTNTKK